jgi:hypothetical protein
LSKLIDLRSSAALRGHRLIEELRGLLIERELLPTGPARKAANDRVKKFLKDQMILPDQGGKPSLPKAEQVVRDLRDEAKVWLPVEKAGRGTALLATAKKRLATWGCTEPEEWWASRLAFAFLTEQELRLVQDDGVADDLKIVFVIHHRVHPLRSIRLVADDAFGHAFVEQHRAVLNQGNPLLPQ